jgi:hypothetical protein
LFGREQEWRALSAFATDPRPGAVLGLVSGQCRPGKSFLLKALCQAAGGFYFAADEVGGGQSLDMISERLAAYRGVPKVRYGSWRDAIDALLALGADRPVPVVIDEFSRLERANPSLPSIIETAVKKTRSQARLLVCAPIMPSIKGVGFTLTLSTFDYRLAAEFWGIDDPLTALKVNAIVGGTPAYRHAFVGNDAPTGPADFDRWVLERVLSPASPLFHEARHVVAGEPDLRDRALYNSLLAAIANGNSSRGGIAEYVGRKSNDLAHPLSVLEDCGLIAREADVFKDNRTSFRIDEPLLAFYYVVMRPIWSDLEHSDDVPRLWHQAQRSFVDNVLSAHLKHVCRVWSLQSAKGVGSGTVNDPAKQTRYEPDVVAFGLDGALLSIGECVWGETMGIDHLDRLTRIRAVLTARGRHGAEDAKLTCFSVTGFTDELRERAAASPDVVLVGAADLYR